MKIIYSIMEHMGLMEGDVHKLHIANSYNNEKLTKLFLNYQIININK